MEQHILKALAEMEEATGWNIWVDYVAKNMKLVTSPGSAGYGQFKRKMSALASSGLIIRTTAERKLAKATWKLTNEGWESLDEPEVEVAQSVDAEKYIGKRLPHPVDRDVWMALMDRFKRGELEIAFVPSKKNRR